LTGTVPGKLAAPINLYDLGAIIGALRVFGSFPGRVYAAVLEQYHCIWPSFGNYLFMYLTLQRKTLVVSNKVRIESSN
jgi:hypothetical protein